MFFFIFQIFDEGNNLVRVIGTKDQLDCPYGLVYDGTDHLIIADMWNDRVSVYSCGEEGKAEGHVLGGERAKLKFTRPAFVSNFSVKNIVFNIKKICLKKIKYSSVFITKENKQIIFQFNV